MKKTRPYYRNTTVRLKLYCSLFLIITILVILYFLYQKPSKQIHNARRVEAMHKHVEAYNAYNRPRSFEETHSKLAKFEGHKVVHIDLKGAPPKISYLKEMFPLFYKMGATGVLIEYEDMFPYSGILKNISALNAYTLDDIHLINMLAEKNNLDVIPLVQTFGHLEFILKLQEFSYLREVDEFPSAVCPTRHETIDVLSEMLRQVLYAHPTAKTIHIGADEVFFMGVCDQCVNVMNAFNLSKKMLYMKHINKVADIVSKMRSSIKILIWDDVIRTFSHSELKVSSMHQSLIPVVWKYTKDVEDELGPSLWSMYAAVFPKVWIGTAFKGATGSDQFVSEVTYYVQNHRSWMSLMSEHRNKLSFEGAVLTGWQRYDHFAILCELLPVSLPSLAMSLRLLDGHNDSPMSAPTDVAKMLKCKQPYGLIGSAFGSPRCSYPGGEILENVLRLQQLKIEYEHFLEDSRTKGWMNDYNIAHDFSNPQYVISVSAPLRRIRFEIEQLDTDITAAMFDVYDNYTIDEWKETFIAPFRKQINHMLDARDKMLDRKSWPRRPFNYKDTRDKEL